MAIEGPGGLRALIQQAQIEGAANITPEQIRSAVGNNLNANEVPLLQQLDQVLASNAAAKAEIARLTGSLPRAAALRTTGDRVGGAMTGGGGGAAIGAIAGGIIGSVVPVVGTATGAWLGALAGGAIGLAIGTRKGAED
jgi:hypothetical protein